MANSKKDTKGRVLKQGEYQLSDGRYRYRYTDQNGEQKDVYSWKLIPTDKIPKGKRDDICLREKEKQIERDLLDGVDVSASKITVNQLFEKYISTKAKLAFSTKNNYIHIWDKNIKNSFLGPMQIDKVKKSDILKLYAYFYETKHFAIGTIQLYQNILYPTFQFAVDDLILRFNPCRNCMKEYVRGSMTSTKYPLDKEEQNRLLKFVQNDTVYCGYYVLIAFLLGTGCRIGEALGMTWNDINLKEKYVSVNHQVIYKKKTDNIQFYSSLPKNKTTRIIPLQDNLVKILSKHKQETYFLSLSSGYKVDDYENFVFLNREGKLYTPNTIVRSFHGIQNAYNKKEQIEAHFEEREEILLPDFSPHTLRHTYCTRMAENGINVKVLQEIMGHKNITITMQVYNHVDIKRTQQEISTLNDVLEA